MSCLNRLSSSWLLLLNDPYEIITYKVDSNGNYLEDIDGNKIVDSIVPSEFFGLSPSELCNKILDIWCGDSKTKTGACAYCISKKGLHHLHILLRDNKVSPFFKIKAMFPRAHIEPVNGYKSKAEEYMYNFALDPSINDETVVCVTYREGRFLKYTNRI